MMTLLVLILICGGLYAAGKAAMKAAGNPDVASGAGRLFMKWLKR